MDIHKDGYVVLRGVLSENDLNNGLSSMMGKQVDYKILKNFIDTIFLPSIIKNQQFITDPHYIKFRFSNNNNSTDASTFHGDIYNHSDVKILPIYTCLCYFDDTRMEIIPGSHIKSNDLSITSYNKKIVIPLQRGDILIFHSNIHHRGVNFDKKGDRRLLQVFDVFPDMETYREHSNKLLIVTADKITKSAGTLSYYISKIPILIDIVSFFHYHLTYYDLQYKLPMLDISPSDKKNRYVSYEAARRVNTLGVEEQNINIICNKAETIPHGTHYRYLIIVYLLLMVLGVFIVYKILTNKIFLRELKKLLSHNRFRHSIIT